MSIVNATDATFDAEVLGGNDVVLVDFWASRVRSLPSHSTDA